MFSTDQQYNILSKRNFPRKHSPLLSHATYTLGDCTVRDNGKLHALRATHIRGHAWLAGDQVDLSVDLRSRNAAAVCARRKEDLRIGIPRGENACRTKAQHREADKDATDARDDERRGVE